MQHYTALHLYDDLFSTARHLLCRSPSSASKAVDAPPLIASSLPSRSLPSLPPSHPPTMGQSLSLCGSRSRPSRSPSLSCESHLPSSSPHFAPLSYHPSTKKGLYEVKDNEDGLCALYPTTSHTELQLIDSDDDDCVDVPHLKYSVKHRSARPGHALSAALSSYPSESSLDNSPVYSDHAAYYTTDDDNSPLSSLSAQGSPDRLTTASSSSSHTIQVIRPLLRLLRVLLLQLLAVRPLLTASRSALIIGR